jgi:hypothetical protein
MSRTLGEQAKELGISTERLFGLLYIDSENYECMKCGNKETGSYSICPKCGESFSYQELPPIIPTPIHRGPLKA